MKVSHIFSKGSIVALSGDQYEDMIMNSKTYTKNNQVGQECVEIAWFVNFCVEVLRWCKAKLCCDGFSLPFVLPWLDF